MYSWAAGKTILSPYAASDPPEEAIVQGRYVLHLDQSGTIGKVHLIYRGLDGDTICLIDVIIPDLDPERPYTYRLDIETAERGFRMAGRNFKLETTKKNYIRIVETKFDRK